MKVTRYFSYLFMFVAVLAFSGCAQTSVEMMKLSESSLQERQLQVKSFETEKEGHVLSSSVATLQDMGFNIDEINRDFGVITCSKTRDAREIGQQVGFFLLALLGGAQAMDLADHTQAIKATVVTVPKQDTKKTFVRLTVQRVLYNHRKQVIGVETIKDPDIYKVFFDKLAKSVFLEAHNL